MVVSDVGIDYYSYLTFIEFKTGGLVAAAGDFLAREVAAVDVPGLVAILLFQESRATIKFLC